jgi:hypothetical protein
MSFTSRTKFFFSLSLQKGHILSSKKKAFIQEILFSFCKWATLAPKKGTFFKKVGPHVPIAYPVARPLPGL